MSTYQDLDIYKIGLALFYQTHPASLKLPKHEMYELGSQLRRASDSVITNIVEGYGRKRYKADFIRFLVFSHSSCLETINHLDKLSNLYPTETENFLELSVQYDTLGAKIYSFIKYVEQNWKS
ncbi:MAG: four helix bundle protein [Flavobacterium psychrophilum]